MAEFSIPEDAQRQMPDGSFVCHHTTLRIWGEDDTQGYQLGWSPAGTVGWKSRRYAAVELFAWLQPLPTPPVMAIPIGHGDTIDIERHGIVQVVLSSTGRGPRVEVIQLHQTSVFAMKAYAALKGPKS